MPYESDAIYPWWKAYWPIGMEELDLFMLLDGGI